MKTTLLIIDDSKELLEIFSMIFEKYGYEIIARTSAVDIVPFIRNHKIDILILDVVLVSENGRRICQELKLNPLTNYFPIILMSASPEFLVDFKECGADGFIEKPFDINIVVNKINSLLDTPM